MFKLYRPVILGLVAYLAWLGFSFLVLLVAAAYFSPFAGSWFISFPVIAVIPALLLAGGVASYHAGDSWFSSSAIVGVAGFSLLYAFAAFSGKWWAVALGMLICVVLALSSGYVVRRFVRRG
jgi:hypothetical protein